MLTRWGGARRISWGLRSQVLVPLMVFKAKSVHLHRMAFHLNVETTCSFD